MKRRGVQFFMERKKTLGHQAFFMLIAPARPQTYNGRKQVFRLVINPEGAGMRISDTELSNAQAWCTPTELRLIESSHGQALAKTSEAELKKKISRARALRDKWRDLFTRQRREAQQARGARVSAENQRSRRKSELFAKALTRFEDQLAKVVAAPAARVDSRTSARPAVIKRERVREHRMTRARTREQLKEQQATLERRDQLEPAVPEPAAAAASNAETVPAPAQTKAKMPRKTAVKKSAMTPKLFARAKLAKNVIPSFHEQKGASTGAKRNRFKISGLDTRIHSHVSARGNRSQARRDVKN
jgi:hypothetical protein